MTVETSLSASQRKITDNVDNRPGKKLQVDSSNQTGVVGSFATMMSLVADTVPTGQETNVDLTTPGLPTFSAEKLTQAKVYQSHLATNNEAFKTASKTSKLLHQTTDRTDTVKSVGVVRLQSTTNMATETVALTEADLSATDVALSLPALPSPLTSAALTLPDVSPMLPEVVSVSPLVVHKSGVKHALLIPHSSSTSAASSGLGLGMGIAEPVVSTVGAASSTPDQFWAAPASNQPQVELRELKFQQPVLQATALTQASNLMTSLISTDMPPKLQERYAAKSVPAQMAYGFEGFFGTTVAEQLGLNPTYEVAAAASVLPDTQLADTLSYWVTHGVQNAELTLDGLGTEPVQVHISLDGDQAQVDFLSDQVALRQVIEDASAQLKIMLSSQGLQLAGMTVGTSRRETGQSAQSLAKAVTHQLTSPLQPLTGAVSRANHSGVGQSLDLYV